MNRNHEQLIEDMKTTTADDVAALISVLTDIEDPVECFRALDSLPAQATPFSSYIDRAKAQIIEEMRQAPDRPSLKSIGAQLGVSAQRVHQLTNPEARKARWKKPTKTTTT